MNDKSLYSRMKIGLAQILQDLDACSLTNTIGEDLHTKGLSFADLGTLPQAATIAHKYFNLQDQQIVVLNDPFSGGTTLNELTIVIGISLTKSSQSDLLLTTRVSFRPTLNFKLSYNSEDFRIPPTPLQGIPGFTAQDILKSISQAPQAPENFLKIVEDQVKIGLERAQEIKSFFGSLFDSAIKKSTFEKLFAISTELYSSWIDELPYDKSSVQMTLDDGSVVALTIQHVQGSVLFDFAGTNLGAKYALTNASLMGICMGSLNSFFTITTAIDHGHFKTLALNTPKTSKLNASNPQSTELGHLVLAPQISNIIYLALSKLVSKRGVAGHATSSYIDIRFSDLHFFERVAGGTGASSQQNGEDGLEVWGRSSLKPSFEEVERRFPLQILRQEKREGSGGRGLRTGGLGLRRTYQVLNAGTLTWFFDSHKPHGLLGGSAGDTPKLLVKTPEGESIELSAHGERQLKAGDQITILSAGGGGYGRAE